MEESLLQISGETILFTIVEVLFLYVLMKKFLFDRVRAIIQKRQDEINNSINSAETSKADAASLKEEYESKLAQAETQRKEIIAQARKEAAAEYDRIIADANKKADELIETAKMQAEEDAKRTMQETRDKMADIVTEAASRIALTKDSSKNDIHLYDEFLDQVLKAE